MTETGKSKNDKKWIFNLIIGVLLTSVIGWAAWMTDKVYSQNKDQAVSRESVEAIKTDVKNIKEELGTFKKEITEKVESSRKETKEDMKEVMKVLREIDKKVK